VILRLIRALDAEPGAYRSPERGIEPRLRQIFAPFLSLIDDPDAHRRAIELLRAYQKDLVSDRALALEARILESIAALLKPETVSLRILDITTELLARFGRISSGR